MIANGLKYFPGKRNNTKRIQIEGCDSNINEVIRLTKHRCIIVISFQDDDSYRD